MTPSKYRVGNVAAGFMLAMAVLIDCAQILFNLLPFIGQVIAMFLGLIAACCFGIWFLLLGVSYFEGKRVGMKLITVFTTTVAEFIPLIDALPLVTVGVLVVILVSRTEDRETKPEEVVASRMPRMKGPQKLPPQAANDNEEEGEVTRAA